MLPQVKSNHQAGQGRGAAGRDGSSAGSQIGGILTKPHGHGDVHALMKTSGTADGLQKGIEHVTLKIRIRWCCGPTGTGVSQS